MVSLAHLGAGSRVRELGTATRSCRLAIPNADGSAVLHTDDCPSPATRKARVFRPALEDYGGQEFTAGVFQPYLDLRHVHEDDVSVGAGLVGHDPTLRKDDAEIAHG